MIQPCDTTDLWRLARQVSIQLERAADRALLAEVGVGTSTYALLSTLSGHERHLTQQEVADLLGLTKSSVSRQLDAAIAAGHLRVAAEQQSRREKNVELTASGARIVDRGLRVVETLMGPDAASADPEITAALRALEPLAARTALL